jgi:hypothetical protein
VHAIRADHTDRDCREKPESVARVLERVGHRQDSAAHAALDQMQERFQIPVENYSHLKGKVVIYKRCILRCWKVEYSIVVRLIFRCAH